MTTIYVFENAKICNKCVISIADAIKTKIIDGTLSFPSFDLFVSVRLKYRFDFRRTVAGNRKLSSKVVGFSILSKAIVLGLICMFCLYLTGRVHFVKQLGKSFRALCRYLKFNVKKVKSVIIFDLTLLNYSQILKGYQ